MKTFRKNDNTVTVKGNDGKIVTNLPAPEDLNKAKQKQESLKTLGVETDTPTEGKTWAEQQKEHTEGLLKTIETSVENLAASGDIENFMQHMSKFHQYSFHNQVLIWVQNQEATQVAGYNRWEEMGRQVRKGEKGMDILAPVIIKAKEKDQITGEETTKEIMKGFRAVKVFDLAQTEPAEYLFKTNQERDEFIAEWETKGYTAEINPENPMKVTISKAPESPAKLLKGQAPAEMVSFVEQELKTLGVEVEEKSAGSMGGANGQSWKAQDGSIRISVRDDVDDAQKYKTLVHEIMHVQLGHLDRTDDYHTGEGGHRGEMEVAVEALSFMVGSRFGLDTSNYSTGYMALWSKQNKEKLKKVLNEDVMPHYKKISERLPQLEETTPPMGTAAQRKREVKASTKKNWRRKKK